MRKMNCYSVRRDIEAADRGDLLSVDATEHIRGCASCEKFNNEHVKLRNMVFNLGTVEAPEDFEFRLRARIARANTPQRSFSLQGLNFGFRSLALASMLVVFGGVMLVANLRQPQQGPVPASENTAQPLAAATPIQQPTSLPVVAAATGNDQATTGRRSDSRTKRADRTGTRDMASAPARVVRSNELTALASEFPVDASPRAVKVSMEDGSGNPRTISVPTVSFGSQRVLSQRNSPLVASARGAW